MGIREYLREKRFRPVKGKGKGLNAWRMNRKTDRSMRYVQGGRKVSVGSSTMRLIVYPRLSSAMCSLFGTNIEKLSQNRSRPSDLNFVIASHSIKFIKGTMGRSLVKFNPSLDKHTLKFHWIFLHRHPFSISLHSAVR